MKPFKKDKQLETLRSMVLIAAAYDWDRFSRSRDLPEELRPLSRILAKLSRDLRTPEEDAIGLLEELLRRRNVIRQEVQ